MPFDRIAHDPPTPSSETSSTPSLSVARSSVTSGPPSGAVQSKGLWKSILKVFLVVVLVVTVLSVTVLINITMRRNGSATKRLTDQDVSRIAAANPYLSKDDIVILGNEIIKRGFNTQQGNTFTLATFKRGIELLSSDEQEEIDRIREQMFSKFSTEETGKVDAIYSKAELGQVTAEEEVQYLIQVQKKAVNNLPESTKLRYRLLMGKALKAGLNMK